MEKLKQMVVMRESHERDEGTMGFHDYVTVKEDFNKFVDRVTVSVGRFQPPRAA